MNWKNPVTRICVSIIARTVSAPTAVDRSYLKNTGWMKRNLHSHSDWYLSAKKYIYCTP